MVFENTGGFSMKKKYLYIVLAVCAIAAFTLAACATTAAAGPAPGVPVQQPSTAAENKVDSAPSNLKLVDWMGRAMGSPDRPEWAKKAFGEDDYNAAAAALKQPDGTVQGGPIYRAFTIDGPDLRGAQMMMDAEFARKIAKELQEKVNTYMAASDTTGCTMSEATKSAIKEITQTESHVTFSGAKIVREFWQTAQNTETKMRYTILYRLYQFESRSWAAIAGGYLQNVLDTLNEKSPHLSPAESEVNNMLAYTLNQSRMTEALPYEEKKMQLANQERMAKAQADLAPAQQRDAAKAELARINSETAIKLGEQRAQASVARTEARAESDAEQAAYASGNPVLTAAASVTPADARAINAAKMALNLLF
jgi:predicted small secreted protein